MILDCGWPSLGWWVIILGIVADRPCHYTLTWFGELSVGAKFQVCTTLPSGQFWIVGDHPWNGGWPSWGWWLTIHGTPPSLNFMSQVYLCQIQYLYLNFLIVHFGWLVTIVGMVDGRPGGGGWPSLAFQLVLILSYVYVPNSKPVARFPLVDLGWWATILWVVGGHPGGGGWPSALHLVLIFWVKSKC